MRGHKFEDRLREYARRPRRTRCVGIENQHRHFAVHCRSRVAMDERAEFLINDRMSFMRFLGLSLAYRVPMRARFGCFGRS